MAIRMLDRARRCRIALLALMLLCAEQALARRAAAQNPTTTRAALASAPSDSIVKLAVDPARHSGQPFVVLLDEGYHRIEADGRLVKRSRQVVQILDQSVARNLSERSFSYARSHQSLTIDWIRVLKTTGAVVSDAPTQSQESDVAAQLSNPVYQEQRVRRVSLSGIAAGTILDVQYTMEERAPVRPGDFFVAWALNSQAPVVQSRFIVDVPEGFTPTIVERNLTARRFEGVAAGRHVYSWAANDVAPIRPEPFAADSNGIVMSIAVSAPGTWSDIAMWYDALARDRYVLSSMLGQRIDSLVAAAGARTRNDTIRAVHRWVAQDIRYVSIALGIAGYQPRAPAEVLTSGFGDCKDKTTLFVAALRRYRMTANPVLLSLSSRPDPALPSIYQFNHAIAAVQDGVTWTYTDLTTEFLPYGTIPGSYQGKFGVMVGADGRGQNVRFPVAPVTANATSMRSVLTLDSLGRVHASVVEESHGEPAMGARSIFATPLDSARRSTAARGLAQRMFASDAIADSITGFDGRNFAEPAVVRYVVRATDVLKSVGNNRLFSMNAGLTGPARSFRNLARELESRPLRLFPIDAAQFLGPVDTETELNLTLPLGWKAELPKDVVATSVFGRYDSKWTQVGREVRMTRHIQGELGTFPPQRIAELIVWLKTVGTDDIEFLSLRTAQVP